MKAAARLVLYVILAMLLLALTAALSGCGGSDTDEPATASTQPVDCKATPERCV